MMPLLQDPLINPYATLTTLFMNVVDENIHNMTIQDIMADMSTMKRLCEYLPLNGMAPINAYDPQVIKRSCALESVATYDHIFDQ